MSDTPHATDVEISRALNALVVTLNDQKAATADVARWQQIVTGALGGEERLHARADELAQGVAGLLLDAATADLRASFRLQEGRWIGRREGAPLSGAYIPN